MTSKQKITIAALTFAGLVAYGYEKYNKAKEVLNNIDINIDSVSNLKLDLPNITFDVVFELKNNTNIDFGATLSSRILIKKIRVYANDIYLGQVSPNISYINIPAAGSVKLPSMPVTIETNKAINEFIGNIGNYLTNDFSNLNYEIDVEVFGNALTLQA